MKNIQKTGWLSTIFLLSVALLAKAEQVTQTSQAFITAPGRAIFSAAGTSIGIFSTDLMQPVYGNKDAFLFGNFMVDYGTDDTYLISPGGGYRKILNNQIVGAYFFGDYEKVSLGKDFWVLSPGIEWMSPHWDAHLNGYFPTTTSKQMGSTVFASTVGDDNQVSFETGTNNQYDGVVTPYDFIGNGMDVELGYSFSGKDNFRSRVYIGGYFYMPPSEVDNITGITGGYEQPISKNLTLSVFNSYDQVSHYTVGVSLSVSFGEDSTIFSNNVSDRMLDQVQRHVGIIGTGAGTYDQEAYESSGRDLQYDNVFFVSQDGTGNGTYGSPTSLTQTSLDAINTESPEGSRIYIAGGDGVVYNVNSTTTNTPPTAGVNGLYIYDNQDVYGRTSDYTASADDDVRPEIKSDGLNQYNAFVVQSGENTFANLNFSTTGVATSTSGNNAIIVLNNSNGTETLNVTNVTINGFYQNGIRVRNQGTTASTILNVNDSQISAFSNSANAIQVNNSTSNSTTTVNATDSEFNNNALNGISVNNVGTNSSTSINTENSTFSNNVDGINVQNATTATGGANSSVTINTHDSQFNNNSNDGIVIMNNGTNSSSRLNLNNSLFNNNGGDGVYNLNKGSNSVLAIYTIDSQFNSNGNDGMLINNNSANKNSVVNTIYSQFNSNGNQGLVVNNNSTSTVAVSNVLSEFNNNGSE